MKHVYFGSWILLMNSSKLMKIRGSSGGGWSATVLLDGLLLVWLPSFILSETGQNVHVRPAGNVRGRAWPFENDSLFSFDWSRGRKKKNYKNKIDAWGSWKPALLNAATFTSLQVEANSLSLNNQISLAKGPFTPCVNTKPGCSLNPQGAKPYSSGWILIFSTPPGWMRVNAPRKSFWDTPMSHLFTPPPYCNLTGREVTTTVGSRLVAVTRDAGGFLRTEWKPAQWKQFANKQFYFYLFNFVWVGQRGYRGNGGKIVSLNLDWQKIPVELNVNLPRLAVLKWLQAEEKEIVCTLTVCSFYLFPGACFQLLPLLMCSGHCVKQLSGSNGVPQQAGQRCYIVFRGSSVFV